MHNHYKFWPKNKIQYSLLDCRSIKPLPRSVERASSEATDMFWTFCSTEPTLLDWVPDRSTHSLLLFLLVWSSNSHLSFQTSNRSHMTLPSCSNVQDKACLIICLKLTSSLRLLALALTPTFIIIVWLLFFENLKVSYFI